MRTAALGQELLELARRADELERELEVARGRAGAPLELVGSAEIAALAGASPNTVSAWRKRGRLPVPVAVLAQGAVWHRADIEAWLQRRGK